MSTLSEHLDWLGYIQPVGLVVSPTALLHAQYVLPPRLARLQEDFQALPLHPLDLPTLVRELLEWEPQDLVDARDIAALHIHLPSWTDVLAPTWAVPKAEGEGWQMLVQREPDGTDLDQRPTHGSGWRESPQLRFERLLRETGVFVGLLVNHDSLRLVYAPPQGESSGHLTFRVNDLTTVAGRPLLGALYMLLNADRLFQGNPDKHLPIVLHNSRRFQNEVSTRLASQVLAALRDLLRGFELADADRHGDLLRGALTEDPQHVYGGLVTVLLRLVFLLYAEERGLMPGDPMWVRHYAISELFSSLRADAGRHPDTMDQRFGAWARLLTLFRLLHRGNPTLGLPARHGDLFDPDLYPFLEGRPHGMISSVTEVVVPRVPDGVVWRVLEALLVLDGERLSYRALDVEQIGSVYEAMMGFELRRASAPSLAVGAGQVISLHTLLHTSPADRNKLLKKEAEIELTGRGAEALRAARTLEDLARAIGKRAADPRIVPEGGLYLEPGEERRRSGSHYTPRTLTAPIVRTTLRPVLDDLGPCPTPAQILDLKVCDPAMGSGAFLVESCRQLADALVLAWQVHDCLPEIPPDEDPHLHARRLVAQRCLYGVDKNPFAVTLAKVSLWLVTLAKDHAFTFLNHALHHGDSLVGLTRRQLGRFDWSADDAQKPPLLAWIERAHADALARRQTLQASGDGEEVRQHLVWREAEDALDPVRLAGDLCLAAFFSADKDKARDHQRLEHQRLLSRARASEGLADVLAARRDLTHGDRPIIPFHWELELPEVFERSTPGFDAIVGNPPFAGKNTLAAANHSGYPAWLKVLHEGSHGNADLVAHFFRRAWGLLRRGGTLGFIATNTLSQGDTRASGLRPIRKSGGWLYEVTRRYKWPGMANVVVSVVHLRKEVQAPPARLDGKPAARITAFLMPGGPDDDPLPLPENEGKSFVGSYVLGMGFTFDDDNPEATPIAEMHRLIATDPRNAERIFPYIGGEEVNDSPTHAHRRYVIHFGDRSEAEAREWPALMAIVENKVKPGRDRLRGNVDAERRRTFWWQWGRDTPALMRATRSLSRVIAISRHQHHWSVSQVAAQQVFSEALIVITSDTLASLTVLQSRVHELWARFFGSSMKDDLRYTPSDCFETFPFPPDWTTSPPLQSAGQVYDDHRASLMIRHEQGLTSTYNRFHDPSERNPDLLTLRDLHAALDRAVLDAYGWTDLRPTCDFRLDYEEAESGDDTPSRRKKPWRLRWSEAMEDEVLSRLLALNRERSGVNPAPPPEPRPKSARKQPPKQPSSPLFPTEPT
jgi:hypothetical protein